MSSALSTGLSGLLAYQRAINVHSQNIANVNTEGYVRQRVELIAQGNSNVLAGSAGVSIAQIRREPAFRNAATFVTGARIQMSGSVSPTPLHQILRREPPIHGAWWRLRACPGSFSALRWHRRGRPSRT